MNDLKALGYAYLRDAAYLVSRQLERNGTQSMDHLAYQQFQRIRHDCDLWAKEVPLPMYRLLDLVIQWQNVSTFCDMNQPYKVRAESGENMQEVVNRVYALVGQHI